MGRNLALGQLQGLPLDERGRMGRNLALGQLMVWD
jgi:hypothetical protein